MLRAAAVISPMACSKASKKPELRRRTDSSPILSTPMTHQGGLADIKIIEAPLGGVPPPKVFGAGRVAVRKEFGRTKFGDFSFLGGVCMDFVLGFVLGRFLDSRLRFVSQEIRKIIQKSWNIEP